MILSVNAFIILVGHNGSSDLPDNLPYPSSLGNNLKSQPAVYQFIQDNKFISMAFLYEKEKLQFNKAQAGILYEWLASGKAAGNKILKQ